MEHPMMFHAVAKHIQTNRHKRLHTRAATAIVQAHAVGTGTVPQDHRQSNQTPHLLLYSKVYDDDLDGSRSESALGRQRHDVNATHRDEVFHLVFSAPHRERWSARLVFLIFPVAPHTLLRANRPASYRNPPTPTTNPRKEHTQIDGTHHLRRRHPHQRRGNRLHKSRKENIRRPVRVPRIPIRPKQTLHKKGTPTPIL